MHDINPVPKGRRRDRGSFERSIERIVQNIESMLIHEVRWKGDYFERNEIRMARVKVKSLWVVGSFARGASTCGDLDLVMDIERIEGPEPRPRTTASQVAGRFPDVVIYIGTPDKNSSHVAFPEAVLLWSQEATDWKTALNQIIPTETSHRFSRRYDALPLRREQFEYYRDLDELVDLYEQGIVAWDWVPIDKILTQSNDCEAEKFLRKMSRFRGKKSFQSLEFAVSWFATQTPPWTWNFYGSSDNRIRMGGYAIATGAQPWLYLDHLDSIACSGVAIIPHISRRGPNGIWILSRGPKHPLEQVAAGLEAYVVCHGDDPMIYDRDKWHPSMGIRFFKHQRKKPVTRHVSGSALLELLSCVEWFSVNGVEYNLNRWWHQETEEKAAIAAFQE